MYKQKVIDKLWTFTDKPTMQDTVNKMLSAKPKDEGLQLFNLVLSDSTDANDIWFTALAVLCFHETDTAGKLLKSSAATSGHHMSSLNKAELIDAIASGSKLTKADAG